MTSKLFAALCAAGLLATFAGCSRGEKAQQAPAQEVDCGENVHQVEPEASQPEGENPEAAPEEPKTPGY